MAAELSRRLPLPVELCDCVEHQLIRLRFKDVVNELLLITWQSSLSSSFRKESNKPSVQYFLDVPEIPEDNFIDSRISNYLFDTLRVYSRKSDLIIKRNSHGLIVITSHH